MSLHCAVRPEPAPLGRRCVYAGSTHFTSRIRCVSPTTWAETASASMPSSKSSARRTPSAPCTPASIRATASTLSSPEYARCCPDAWEYTVGTMNSGCTTITIAAREKCCLKMGPRSSKPRHLPCAALLEGAGACCVSPQGHPGVLKSQSRISPSNLPPARRKDATRRHPLKRPDSHERGSPVSARAHAPRPAQRPLRAGRLGVRASG
jgi:hypothetical protein